MSTEDLDAAERTVLGAMLTSTEAVADVAHIITGADFLAPRHETIHDAITAQASAGRPHDWVAVATALREHGDLDRVGGSTYLADLAGACLVPSAAPWHAGTVREASRKRAVRAIGAKLQDLADTDGPAAETIDAARQALDDLAAPDARADDADIDMPDAIDAALASLDAPPGIPTPWGRLTSTIGGWKAGELIVCAARPGVGKSVVGISAALDAARHGHAVALFSLEMSRSELILRMLSAISGVDGQRIQTRTLRPEDRDGLAQARKHLDRLPIAIDDRANLSLAQINAKIRSLSRRRRVDLVVVDYLGRVKPPAGVGKNDRRVQVDAISWGLKETARTHDVPVLALAQLNRAIEARKDTAPLLSDLRESGGIEADADIVLLMHRQTDAERGDPSDLRMHVGKNRHGPQNAIRLDFAGHLSRITEPAWTPARSIA